MTIEISFFFLSSFHDNNAFQNEELKVDKTYFLLPELFFETGLIRLSILSFLFIITIPNYSLSYQRVIFIVSNIRLLFYSCLRYTIMKWVGGGHGINVHRVYQTINEHGHGLGVDSIDGKYVSAITPSCIRQENAIVIVFLIMETFFF